MAEPIDFWFDFSSPYGYLMSERIDELAARFGRKVRWHPILLGVVFKATGSAPLTLQHPAKAAYALRDFERSARFLGIPYRRPTRFPLPTQNAARAYYWLHGQDCALARRFAHAVYRALFVDDRDISAPATVLEIAANLGVDRASLDTALQSPGNQGAAQGRSRQRAAHWHLRLAACHHRRRSILRRRPPAANRALAGNRRLLKAT